MRQGCGPAGRAGRSGWRLTMILAAAALTPVAAIDAGAAPPERRSLDERVRQLEERVGQQERLLELYRRFSADPGAAPAARTPTVAVAAPAPGGARLTPVQDGPRPGAPSATGGGGTAAPPAAGAAGAAGAASEERPESEKPLDQLLIEAGGVLLPPGTLQLEPGVEYLHASSNQVVLSGVTFFDAINIGTFRVDAVDRDVVTTSLSARLGLLRGLQLETEIPYVYARSQTNFGIGQSGGVGQEEITNDTFGIGDIDAGLSWQALYARRWIPDTVLRLRARFPTGKSVFDIGTETTEGGRVVLNESPTGSGVYGLNPSATLVWRVDPVVFFAGGGYTYNFENDFKNNRRVDPGDVIEYFGGMNVSLSELVAFNLSFIDQIAGSTEVNGSKLDGTNINDARLSLGASIGLSDKTVLVVTAQAGLTEDSPDFVLNVSVPTTLRLFD